MSALPAPDDFVTDLSALLRPGVYVLKHGARVAYIGKARCILAALTNHVIRNRSPIGGILRDLFPPIAFDGLGIIPCDSVRAIQIQAAMISLYDPPHNRTRKPAPAPAPVPPASTPAPSPIRRL